MTHQKIYQAWEFSAVFVAAPTLLVVFYDSLSAFAPLFALAAAGVGLFLVSSSGEFRHALALQAVPIHASFLAVWAAIAALSCLTLAWLHPNAQPLSFPMRAPVSWAVIMLVYPLISVTVQELIFRALFWARYADLFPSPSSRVIANALAFALAHAFYANAVAILGSFALGVVLAGAYETTRSLAVAWMAHALAGAAVFSSGVGVFVYHGAI